MSNRQERRRQRQMRQDEKAAANIQITTPRDNWLKKIPIYALVVGILGLLVTVAVNVTPYVMRMLTPKPEVHIGVAFYAYERGWTIEGKMMQTFSELRNLPSNCYFWQIPPRPLGKDTKLIGVHSWVQSKFRFENISEERITNLRMSIASPLLNSATVVSHTPNVEAKGKFDTTHNDTRHTYIVTIEAIPPKESAIVSFETPMDKGLYRLLYDDHNKVSFPVVSFSADQFSKHNPQIDKANGQTMYTLETELRTGEKNVSMAEKTEIRILAPSEPEPEDVSDRLLPSPSHCTKGTACNW